MLPTYPFAKERHWLPKGGTTGAGPREIVVQSTLHPLLDENVSTFEEQAFAKKLSKDGFYLRDHLVGGEAVLPGAAHLEMARAAGDLAGGQKATKLENIAWIRPLKAEKKAEETKISLRAESERVFWSVSVGKNEKAIYSRGELSYGSPDLDAISPLYIESVKKRCSKSVGKAELYQRFKKSGLNYGASFQVVETLGYNKKESLAELKLPDFLSSDFEKFGLHPSLLDGALQTATGLAMSEEGATFLPFALKKLEIFRPMEKEMYAYATSGSNMKSFDVKILNLKGEVLTALEGFGVRA